MCNLNAFLYVYGPVVIGLFLVISLESSHPTISSLLFYFSLSHTQNGKASGNNLVVNTAGIPVES